MTQLRQESPANKAPLVQEVFERADRYLNRRRYDINIRAAAVAELLKNARYDRILDIGCGDGSISLPLIARDRHLTLLDFSSAMLSAAKASIPPEFAGNVEVRQEDFMKAAFEVHSFDLIICLGLMAHVDSPDAFLKKLSSLLRADGLLILEFTDAFHFMGRLSRFIRRLREFARPPLYSVNLWSFHRIRALISASGLQILSTFRYSLPAFPGSRLLGQRSLFRIVRGTYGEPGRNRNAWMGNEYICLLRTQEVEK
jgi:ubiquinone/menaquinone biosynthesis C-methylase UbiE